MIKTLVGPDDATIAVAEEAWCVEFVRHACSQRALAESGGCCYAKVPAVVCRLELFECRKNFLASNQFIGHRQIVVEVEQEVVKRGVYIRRVCVSGSFIRFRLGYFFGCCNIAFVQKL